MAKIRKYHINLSPQDRERLQEITSNGHAPAKKILHAQILLMRDQHHLNGRWKDAEIARALNTHRNTIYRVCKRYITQGETPALNRHQRKTPPTPAKLDGRQEAMLVATCCAQPPTGRARWTLSLLVETLQKRGVVASISRETVRKTLKKTSFNLGEKNATASPRRT